MCTWSQNSFELFDTTTLLRTGRGNTVKPTQYIQTMFTPIPSMKFAADSSVFGAMPYMRGNKPLSTHLALLPNHLSPRPMQHPKHFPTHALLLTLLCCGVSVADAFRRARRTNGVWLSTALPSFHALLVETEGCAVPSTPRVNE